MPEGHLIHRLASDHSQSLANQALHVSSPNGRCVGVAEFLDGRELQSVDAFGKHLIYRWQGAKLHVHLGLKGSFRQERSVHKQAVRGASLRLANSEISFALHRPLKCELLSPLQVDRLRKRLGPDPLRNDADPGEVWRKLNRSQQAIGAVLLDQSVIAGIGNIYRSEILFKLGIHPNRIASTLCREEFDALWQMSVRLLTIGKQHNRIITVEPRTFGKPLDRLGESESTLVYRKRLCQRCHNIIQSWPVAHRTIYACPGCQTHQCRASAATSD